jgi:hypothetical protein
MPLRFSDNGASVYDFGDEFLVVCPSCSKRAVVLAEEPDKRTARITCPACGYAKTGHAQRVSASNVPQDWYFGLPLWLNMRCLGEELWARNAEHLAFLEEFVGAEIRERPRVDPSATFHWWNRHLSSRLPRWSERAHRQRGQGARSTAGLRAL